MPIFTDDPSPWWQYLFMIPFYYGFTWAVSEYLMRRNPHWAFWVAIVSLFFIPINLVIGSYPSGFVGTFLVIKSYSLVIPWLVMGIFRMFGPLYSSAMCNGQNEDICDEMKEKREKWQSMFPASMREYLKLQCVKLGFEKFICWFFYLFLFLNIFEALLFESAATETLNSDNEFAKYLNVIAGLLVCATAPFPLYNPNKYNIRTWYVDNNGDFIMYVPNKANGDYTYFGILWIITYTTWNFEFLVRFGGSEAVLFIPIHLVIPLGVCLWKYQFGLWLEIRLYTLTIYTVYLFVLRNTIFGTTNISSNFFGDSWFLCVLCIFNIIFAITYTYFWYFKYLPHRQSEEKETNLTQSNKNTTNNNNNNDNDDGGDNKQPSPKTQKSTNV